MARNNKTNKTDKIKYIEKVFGNKLSEKNKESFIPDIQKSRLQNKLLRNLE